MTLMIKKIPLLILLIICFSQVRSQTKIIVLSGEYVGAENYGGKVEFKRFMQQEMHYPTSALNAKIEGIVEVASLVDMKGRATRVHVKSSVSKELDAEAIRLYKMLLFKPSVYFGEKNKVYRTLKFKFSIKSYKKYCKKRGYNKINLNLIDSTYAIFNDAQVKLKPRMVFKDSLANISSFIYKNLKYPEGTLRLGITGVVKLFFVIESSGRITNIKVLKDLGGGATNEAIRLLKLTKWTSGKVNGENVRVSKTFEVNFNLSNDSGMDYVPSSY